MVVNTNSQNTRDIENTLSGLGIDAGKGDGIADETLRGGVHTALEQLQLVYGNSYEEVTEYTDEIRTKVQAGIKDFLNGDDYKILKAVMAGRVPDDEELDEPIGMVDRGKLIILAGQVEYKNKTPAEAARTMLEAQASPERLKAMNPEILNDLPKALEVIEDGKILGQFDQLKAETNLWAQAAPAGGAAGKPEPPPQDPPPKPSPVKKENPETPEKQPDLPGPDLIRINNIRVIMGATGDWKNFDQVDTYVRAYKEQVGYGKDEIDGVFDDRLYNRLKEFSDSELEGSPEEAERMKKFAEAMKKLGEETSYQAHIKALQDGKKPDAPAEVAGKPEPAAGADAGKKGGDAVADVALIEGLTDSQKTQVSDALSGMDPLAIALIDLILRFLNIGSLRDYFPKGKEVPGLDSGKPLDEQISQIYQDYLKEMQGETDKALLKEFGFESLEEMEKAWEGQEEFSDEDKQKLTNAFDTLKGGFIKDGKYNEHIGRILSVFDEKDREALLPVIDDAFDRARVVLVDSIIKGEEEGKDWHLLAGQAFYKELAERIPEASRHLRLHSEDNTKLSISPGSITAGGTEYSHEDIHKEYVKVNTASGGEIYTPGRQNPMVLMDDEGKIYIAGIRDDTNTFVVEEVLDTAGNPVTPERYNEIEAEVRTVIENDNKILPEDKRLKPGDSLYAKRMMDGVAGQIPALEIVMQDSRYGWFGNHDHLKAFLEGRYTPDNDIRETPGVRLFKPDSEDFIPSAALRKPFDGRRVPDAEADYTGIDRASVVPGDVTDGNTGIVGMEYLYDTLLVRDLPVDMRRQYEADLRELESRPRFGADAHGHMYVDFLQQGRTGAGFSHESSAEVFVELEAKWNEVGPPFEELERKMRTLNGKMKELGLQRGVIASADGELQKFAQEKAELRKELTEYAGKHDIYALRDRYMRLHPEHGTGRLIRYYVQGDVEDAVNDQAFKFISAHYGSKAGDPDMIRNMMKGDRNPRIRREFSRSAGDGYISLGGDEDRNPDGSYKTTQQIERESGVARGVKGTNRGLVKKNLDYAYNKQLRGKTFREAEDLSQAAAREMRIAAETGDEGRMKAAKKLVKEARNKMKEARNMNNKYERLDRELTGRRDGEDKGLLKRQDKVFEAEDKLADEQRKLGRAKNPKQAEKAQKRVESAEENLEKARDKLAKYEEEHRLEPKSVDCSDPEKAFAENKFACGVADTEIANLENELNELGRDMDLGRPR